MTTTVQLPVVKEYGLRVEAKTLKILRDGGWKLEANEMLDRSKIDLAVIGWNDRILRVPGAVQLTFDGGSRAKLQGFLDMTTWLQRAETRRTLSRLTDVQGIVDAYQRFPAMACFYIVAAKGMEADEIGVQISDVLETHLVHTSVRPDDVIGIFLRKGKPWKTFNPGERLEHLIEREDPAASADRRKSGKIVRTNDTGFFIRTEDGPEYFAYDSATSGEPRLERLIRRFRKDGGVSPIGQVVNFIAHYEEKDRQYRALAVVFNNTATTAIETARNS